VWREGGGGEGEEKVSEARDYDIEEEGGTEGVL